MEHGNLPFRVLLRFVLPELKPSAIETLWCQAARSGRVRDGGIEPLDQEGPPMRCRKGAEQGNECSVALGVKRVRREWGHLPTFHTW